VQFSEISIYLLHSETIGPEIMHTIVVIISKGKIFAALP
jgi:hypothetical protein